LWLNVLSTNTAAIKIYTKAGFVEEGRHRNHIYRDGQYYDYILMGLLHDEYNSAVSGVHVGQGSTGSS